MQVLGGIKFVKICQTVELNSVPNFFAILHDTQVRTWLPSRIDDMLITYVRTRFLNV